MKYLIEVKQGPFYPYHYLNTYQPSREIYFPQDSEIITEGNLNK